MAKVEDLQQNGIDLELMHMPPPDRPFDVQAFYKVLYAVLSVLNILYLHETFYATINF